MTSENNTPIEHQNVPTAHQGLHSFLYSSDSEHDVNTNSLLVDSDGTAIIAVSEWLCQTENTKVAGVYAPTKNLYNVIHSLGGTR